MGSIGCCCGCCSGACSRTINRVEVELVVGYSPVVFTKVIGRPITERCFEWFGFGDWCTWFIGDHGGGAGYVTDTLYDLTVTITHYTTPTPTRFEIACDPITIADPDYGILEMFRKRSSMQYSFSGSSHSYSWPLELFDATRFPGTNFINAVYNGTLFSFAISEPYSLLPGWVGGPIDNRTDATVAASIKSQISSALSSAYTEFLPENFDVTVTRNHIASCGSSLGLVGRTAATTSDCTRSIFSATVSQVWSRYLDGFLVEISPNAAVITFKDKFTSTRTFSGSSSVCPSASGFGYSAMLFQVLLTNGQCFDTEYTQTIRFPGITSGNPIDCGTCTIVFDTGSASYQDVVVKLRVIYD